MLPHQSSTIVSVILPCILESLSTGSSCMIVLAVEAWRMDGGTVIEAVDGTMLLSTPVRGCARDDSCSCDAADVFAGGDGT